MPNIYVRAVPRDVYTEMKKIKKALGTKTWISFFYEICRRLKTQLEQEGIIID